MKHTATTRRWQGLRLSLIGLSLFLLPLFVSLTQHALSDTVDRPWWSAERGSIGLSPDPRAAPQALVQVFSARAVGWRGAVGVHTWVAVKRQGAASYTRYEVMGWGVRRGRSAVRIGPGVPDGHWFGAAPVLLAELRGEPAQRAIEIIDRAARNYPYADRYRVWPGPNSNTFTAHLARQVPDLKLDLPPTAVGKDYLPWRSPLAWAPSGTGLQISFGGLLGLLVAGQEGVEVQLLGLTLGIDLDGPALKLPGFGRLGPQAAAVADSE